MPKAYGRSYRPVGVVFVPCFREPPSTSPPEPKRAGAEPSRTQRPSRRLHQVTVPVVEEVRGATAVMSRLPPPVSAIRSGNGGCEGDGGRGGDGDDGGRAAGAGA